MKNGLKFKHSLPEARTTPAMVRSLLAAGILAFAGNAIADTEIFTLPASIELGSTQLTIPVFNPALGPLDSATIELSGTLTESYTATSSGPDASIPIGPIPFDATVYTAVAGDTILQLDPGITLTVTSSYSSIGTPGGTFPGTYFDAHVTQSGTGSEYIDQLNTLTNSSLQSLLASSTSPAYTSLPLSLYLYEFPPTPDPACEYSACNSLVQEFSFTGTETITYTYGSAVPEPKSCVLWFAGLMIIAVSAKSRRHGGYAR